jgi:hypothetical protein
VARHIGGAARGGGGAPTPTTAPAPVTVTLTVHPGSVHRGESWSLSGTLSSCNGCTVTVDWGDGGVQSIAVSGTGFVAAHSYAVKGRYLPVFTVHQAGAVVGQATRRVVVNNG